MHYHLFCLVLNYFEAFKQNNICSDGSVSHTFERYMFITAKIADSQQIIAFSNFFSLLYQLDPLVLQWNFVADNIKFIFSMSNVKHYC